MKKNLSSGGVGGCSKKSCCVLFLLQMVLETNEKKETLVALVI